MDARRLMLSTQFSTTLLTTSVKEIDFHPAAIRYLFLITNKDINLGYQKWEFILDMAIVEQ